MRARSSAVFETYAVTTVAMMLLGSTGAAATTGTNLWLYPLAIGGTSIVSSLVGVQSDWIRSGGHAVNALMRAVLIATALSAVAFVAITMAFGATGRFGFDNL